MYSWFVLYKVWCLNHILLKYVITNYLFIITGDEILAVNGNVCHDLTHSEAITLFKSFKSGSIVLHICRRSKASNR